MMTEKYGFINSSGQIQNAVKDSCTIMEIPYNLNQYDIGFGFPKHFPFIDLFNYFISKNFENGNLKRIKEKWLKKTSKVCGSSTQLDSMGFDNVVSAFILIIIGIVITIIVFIIELCFFHKAKSYLAESPIPVPDIDVSKK